MYSRNCGSNWPRSCALIARSTRGSALIGPGPISSRGTGLRSSTMGMVLQPVAGDVDPAGDPNLLAPDVLEKSLQRFEAARTSYQPAVESHGHHAVAFLVQRVERVLEVGEELVPRVEALRGGEAH